MNPSCPERSLIDSVIFVFEVSLDKSWITSGRFFVTDRNLVETSSPLLKGCKKARRKNSWKNDFAKALTLNKFKLKKKVLIAFNWIFR